MTDPRNIDVETFYSGPGQSLVCRERFPVAIQAHLVLEGELLLRCLIEGGYTTVVEVGCMNGCLHSEEVIALGVKYIGIDLVARSVGELSDSFRARFAEREYPRAQVLDACRLSELREELADDKTAAVFSFNSFGNLAQPGECLREIARSGFDAVICTYRTDVKSSEYRAMYYAACGYPDISAKVDECGVRFQSPVGLDSWAYHEEWIRANLRLHGLVLRALPFGELGVLFHVVRGRWDA